MASKKSMRFGVRGLACGVGAAVLTWGGAAGAAPVDISGSFNRDTIATSTTSDVAGGYTDAAGNTYFFVTEGFTGNAGVSGTNIPDSGVIATPGGGPTYTLGVFNGNNTVFTNGSAVVDVPNAQYSQLSVLYSFVFIANDDVNGTATVNYTTGSPQVFAFDSADNANTGHADTAVVARTGMDLYNTKGTASTGDDSVIADNLRTLFSQSFSVDPARTVDSTTFNVDAVRGVQPNVQVGIYALDAAAVPEPAGLSMLGLVALGLSRRRR